MVCPGFISVVGAARFVDQIFQLSISDRLGLLHSRKGKARAGMNRLDPFGSVRSIRGRKME